MSWSILDSLFTGNKAIGTGANPPKTGTPGGGNGGAIYNDGNEMLLHVEGTRIEGNTSNHEGGSGIFFVSNDRSGSVEIVDSILRNNTGDGFKTHPGHLLPGRLDHVHRLDGGVDAARSTASRIASITTSGSWTCGKWPLRSAMT